MSCDAGVCTATASKAVLNVGDLQTMLASGDVAAKTGSVANDIAIVRLLSWNSTSRLTLDANTNLNVQAPVTVTGSGAITLTYNNSGSKGDLIFSNGGNATFANLSSSLVINGNSYTLIGDIKSLASATGVNPYGFYALARDYDASTDGTYRHSPITQFTGTLEGLGHSIFHLAIRAGEDSDVGLFARFFVQKHKPAGALRNLALNDVIIKGANVVGALVGISNSNIHRCFVTGTVRASGTVGGLVGATGGEGVVSNSGADVTVEGGRSETGGLVGSAAANISDSFARGSVSGRFAGGLAGGAAAIIQRSYSVAKVTGQGNGSRNHFVGGLVGGGGIGSVIVDSYATGSVTGATKGLAGGLAGFMYKFGGKQTASFMATSYSTGLVQCGAEARCGGFSGLVDGVRSNFWDVTTSGTSQGVGKGCGSRSCQANVTGLTDDQLKSALPDGFNPAIWGQSPDINNGYPYLLANPPQ